MTTQERIKADAIRYAHLACTHIGSDEYADYIAGATAEHERAQEEIKRANDAAVMFCNKHNVVATQLAELVDKAKVLVDALEQFITRHEGGLLPDKFTYKKGVQALAEWSEKEVGEAATAPLIQERADLIREANNRDMDGVGSYRHSDIQSLNDDRNEFAEWCRMQPNYGFVRGMGWICSITQEYISTDQMYELFKQQKEK